MSHWTPKQFLDTVIWPGLVLMSETVDNRLYTPEAALALLAIALQESRGLDHRRQMENGPARSFWQHERGTVLPRRAGICALLTHKVSEPIIRHFCEALTIPYLPEASIEVRAADLWRRSENNDLLALSMARALLWTLPWALPAIGDEKKLWGQYLSAWNPGKPHPEHWPGYYAQAQDAMR